ncbi:YciI family protein [Novosphingobium sp. 11B]
MLWTIYCVDKPNTAHIRAELMQKHRKFMERYSGSILFSGPLVSDDDENYHVGSLFVLNGDKNDLELFLADEPFGRGGIFAQVMVRRMRIGRLNPAATDPQPIS